MLLPEAGNASAGRSSVTVAKRVHNFDRDRDDSGYASLKFDRCDYAALLRPASQSRRRTPL